MILSSYRPCTHPQVLRVILDRETSALVTDGLKHVRSGANKNDEGVICPMEQVQQS